MSLAVEPQRKQPLEKDGIVATTLFAHQIGATAYAATLDLDRSWSVLASVSGAIYIESDAEEILWIAAASSALHPRAILIPSMPTEPPAVGSMCCLEGDCLHIGECLTIKLSNAELWSPQISVERGTSASLAARNLTSAIGQLALQSPPQEHLARASLSPSVRYDDRDAPNTIEQSLLAATQGLIELLRDVSTLSELREWLKDAIELVGLGQGLTPSGDDLLGAFLYTFYVLDLPHLGLADEWLQQARLLTNKISFSILADHAHGDAAAPLHDFLNAALDERPLEDLVRAAGRVSEIGQSSGWDMLVGVHHACTVVARIVHDESVRCVSPSDCMGTRKLRQQDEHLKEVVHVC